MFLRRSGRVATPPADVPVACSCRGNWNSALWRPPRLRMSVRTATKSFSISFDDERSTKGDTHGLHGTQPRLRAPRSSAANQPMP